MAYKDKPFRKPRQAGANAVVNEDDEDTQLNIAEIYVPSDTVKLYKCITTQRRQRSVHGLWPNKFGREQPLLKWLELSYWRIGL
jgi:hypothetical protein